MKDYKLKDLVRHFDAELTKDKTLTGVAAFTDGEDVMIGASGLTEDMGILLAMILNKAARDCTKSGLNGQHIIDTFFAAWAEIRSKQ